MRVLMVVVVVAGAMAMLFGGCSKEGAREEQVGEVGGEPTSKQILGDQAMAVSVNGRVITNQEIAQEENRLRQQMGRQMDPQQMAAMQDVMRKQAIDNMINRVLLEQAMESRRIEVSQQDVDSRIAEIKENMGSEEAFAARLTAMGMTEDQVRRDLETSLKMEKLLSEYAGDIEEVTDAEARDHYEQNTERFEQPDQVKASHVLIEIDPGASEAEKAEKRQEASRILDELRQGADFAQMARQHSACPSRERGGDVGYFGRGQMVKPFEDAAFNLKEGQLSGVVETEFGYHIIKVTDKQEARTVPFNEVKENLRAFLSAQKKQQALDAYAQELRAAADIEYPESDKAE